MSTLELLSTKFSNRKFLGSGISGLVFETSFAIKYAGPTEEAREDHEIECSIYRRLGEHPSIVSAFAIGRGEQHFIILEKMGVTLREYLEDARIHNKSVPDHRKLQWVRQLAEGMSHMHSLGIYQGDVGAHNVLMNDSMELVKICDFAGSSIDGKEATVCASENVEYPWTDEALCKPSARSDLFALGGLIYEISTMERMYQGKPSSEIRKLKQAHQYPHTEGLVLGEVINNCWRSKYTCAEQIVAEVKELEAERRRVSSLRYLPCTVMLATFGLWQFHAWIAQK